MDSYASVLKAKSQSQDSLMSLSMHGYKYMSGGDFEVFEMQTFFDWSEGFLRFVESTVTSLRQQDLAVALFGYKVPLFAKGGAKNYNNDVVLSDFPFDIMDMVVELKDTLNQKYPFTFFEITAEKIYQILCKCVILSKPIQDKKDEEEEEED